MMKPKTQDDYGDITIPRRVEIINSELGPAYTVLEVGAKDGRLTNSITNVRGIIGLDLDREAIAKAKEHQTKNVRFIVGDAYDLPFKNDSFDAVIAGDIIEHLVNGDRMLSEMHRVLKKGGKIIISCPYHGKLKNILISLLNFDTHFDTQGEHIRFYSVNSLTSALKRNGFEVTRKYFIGRFPYVWRDMLFVGVK